MYFNKVIKISPPAGHASGGGTFVGWLQQRNAKPRRMMPKTISGSLSCQGSFAFGSQGGSHSGKTSSSLDRGICVGSQPKGGSPPQASQYFLLQRSIEIIPFLVVFVQTKALTIGNCFCEKFFLLRLLENDYIIIYIKCQMQ